MSSFGPLLFLKNEYSFCVRLIHLFVNFPFFLCHALASRSKKQPCRPLHILWKKGLKCQGLAYHPVLGHCNCWSLLPQNCLSLLSPETVIKQRGGNGPSLPSRISYPEIALLATMIVGVTSLAFHWFVAFNWFRFFCFCFLLTAELMELWIKLKVKPPRRTSQSLPSWQLSFSGVSIHFSQEASGTGARQSEG